MALCIEKICRACMAEAKTLIAIWPMNPRLDNPDGPSTIADMLRSFTTIDASQDDGLPGHLCFTCFGELNRAFSFKQKCERSEFTMKAYLQHMKPVSESSTTPTPTIITTILRTTPIPEDQIDDEDRNDDIIINTTDSIDYLDDNSESMDKNMIFLMPKGDAIVNEDSKDSKDDNDIETTNTVYDCSSCSTGFFTYSSSSQHILNEQEAFHCKHCKLYFDADAYEVHKREHEEDNETPSDATKFNCDVCVLRFDKREAFDEHCTKFHIIEGEPFDDELDFQENLKYEMIEGETVQNETENIVIGDGQSNSARTRISGDEKFYCSNCNAVFAKQLSLNIHFNSKRCMQRSFQCDMCHKIFVKKSNLSSHMKLHGSRRELSCTTCKVEFRDRDQYLVHMKNRHPDSKKYICTQCPKSFSMLSTLKDHLRIHSGEKPFLCSICGKGFSQNTNLKQHVMRHNQTKPFKCSTCASTFVSKGELVTHLRKHTGDHPFRCNVCGSGFTTSSSLTKHKRSHSGERPYACTYCPMRFAALGTLKNHRRTHTGERPFKCTFCPRSFSQKSDCVTHIRTHTGERPYQCRQCDASFSHNTALKAHIKTHRFSAPQNSPNTNDTPDSVEVMIEVT